MTFFKETCSLNNHVWITCVWCILLLDAGSHWMPRFWARLWDKDPAMAKLLPYCGHSRDQGLFTCSHTHCDMCGQTLDRKSDLIDPHSAAHRTHAPKVRCAAPAVVEGHISTRMIEDRGRHEQQVKNKNKHKPKSDRNRFCFSNQLTRWGAQHRRGVWCSAAGTWRNPAAFQAASRWWGCDPCLSRSPQQRAPHAYVVALWRPAIEVRSEREGSERQRETEATARGEENNTGCEFESVLSEEEGWGDAAHWGKGGTGGC